MGVTVHRGSDNPSMTRREAEDHDAEETATDEQTPLRAPLSSRGAMKATLGDIPAQRSSALIERAAAEGDVEFADGRDEHGHGGESVAGGDDQPRSQRAAQEKIGDRPERKERQQTRR